MFSPEIINNVNFTLDGDDALLELLVGGDVFSFDGEYAAIPGGDIIFDGGDASEVTPVYDCGLLIFYDEIYLFDGGDANDPTLDPFFDGGIFTGAAGLDSILIAMKKTNYNLLCITDLLAPMRARINILRGL